LEAGDDAKNVKWMDIDSNIKLYASHLDIVKKVVDNLNVHW
jgi:ADP-ribose pyrophosphatase